eukprot:750438-Hanusia_phi.AAC.1
MLQDLKQSQNEDALRSITKHEDKANGLFVGAAEDRQRKATTQREREREEDVAGLITEGFGKVLAALERLERRFLAGDDRTASHMRKDETKSSVSVPSVPHKSSWTGSDPQAGRERVREEEEKGSQQEDYTPDSSSVISVGEEISLRLEGEEEIDVNSSVKRALLSSGDLHLRANNYREAFEAYRSTLQLTLSKEEWTSRIVTEELTSSPSLAHQPTSTSSTAARASVYGGKEQREASGRGMLHRADSVPNLQHQAELFIRSPPDREEEEPSAEKAESEPLFPYPALLQPLVGVELGPAALDAEGHVVYAEVAEVLVGLVLDLVRLQGRHLVIGTVDNCQTAGRITRRRAAELRVEGRRSMMRSMSFSIGAAAW